MCQTGKDERAVVLDKSLQVNRNKPTINKVYNKKLSCDDLQIEKLN